MHDAIRQQQLAVGATGRILAALRDWGSENEEILWAVLFSLAVLVRDGANPFQPAIRAVAAAGIPPMLTTALDTYKASWRPLLCFLAAPTEGHAGCLACSAPANCLGLTQIPLSMTHSPGCLVKKFCPLRSCSVAGGGW